ncbi:hypothetical protein LMG3458_02498 [Achromobacter deleyi]|uniref:Bacteriophage T7 tail fibre protein-like N-terminal domain-containing protein n=1 Tax=Achromobacter deleyi TaxID=1353891 RepID=A0A6S6ZWI3_9BURK|nr:phage tail fiber protein [Achromobacter deleyi]CAB3698093.1 hypothetical protein LMG3458_02498 [Achromobacter deleyi]
MLAPELRPWIASTGQDGKRYSMQEFAGDGARTSFEVNFAGGYIDPENVRAYTYVAATGEQTPVTVVLTGPNTISVVPAVPVGTFLVVYRDTEKSQPLVDFVDGAVLSEANLDKVARQAIYATAEMVDRFYVTAQNVSDLTAEARAATERSQLALGVAEAASAAASSAVSTAAQALAGVEGAEQAAIAATAAAQAATAAADNANQTAADVRGIAQAAEGKADAAVATAGGIDGKAQSALDTSIAANAAAVSALSVANGIDAKAQSALENSGAAMATANSAATTASEAFMAAASAQTTANDADLRSKENQLALHQRAGINNLTGLFSGNFTNDQRGWINYSGAVLQPVDRVSGRMRTIGPGHHDFKLGVVGINGQDTTAQLTGTVNYFLVANGSGAGVVASSASPSNGPAMPAGYTHWVWFCSVQYGTGGAIMGNTFRYDVVAQLTTMYANPTPNAQVVTPTWQVPPTATSYEVMVRTLVVTSTSPAEAVTALRWATNAPPTQANATVYAYASSASYVYRPFTIPCGFTLFGWVTFSGPATRGEGLLEVTGYTLPNNCN